MDANESIDAVVAVWCVPLTVLAAALFVGSATLATVEPVLVRCTGTQAWRWSPAPPALRRILFAACGVSLVVATPTSVHADPAHPAPRVCTPHCSPRLDGLRLPDLPVGDRRGDLSPQRPARPSVPAAVLVRPGDCLWTLAADLAGARSADSAIARTVQALYRVNRTAIGPDPDLILPGTRLTTPEVLR
jgi:hypothetical protein